MAVGTGNPVTLPEPYHMTFRLMKNGHEEYSWTFSINPQSYQYNDPVNTQVLQTLAGGYADVLGRGLPTIQLQGTTAQRLHSDHKGGVVDGITALKSLKQEVFDTFVDNQFLDDTNTYELRFYNWSIDQYYSVIFASNGFTLSETVSQPVWWYYDISLVCLKPLPAPSSLASSNTAAISSQAYASVSQAQDSLQSRYGSNAASTATSISASLINAAAGLEGMVANGNVSLLPSNLQAALLSNPIVSLPGQALTAANFPGISSYIGSLNGNNSDNTILGLLNNTVLGLVGAIQNGSGTGTIPYPYAQMTSIIAEWKSLYNNIYNDYVSAPPTQLLSYMLNIIQGLSGLAALESVYVPPSGG